MKKQNFAIRFHECEHYGDLDMYIYDLRQSGAKIIDSGVNDEAETGYVYVDIENFEAFLVKFKTTSSFDFSSLHNL